MRRIAPCIVGLTLAVNLAAGQPCGGSTLAVNLAAGNLAAGNLAAVLMGFS